MSDNKNIMVTVCIVTYNQEKWIRQTLDSVLAQQTEYPFEVIIGEDHGTDDTRTICQEYADNHEKVTLLPLAPNMGVTANWIQCVKAGTGKYIMTCAGDDWWHNENKIQLQIDFMQSHPNCNLCYGGVVYYNTITGNNTQKVGYDGPLSLSSLLVRNPVAAVSSCYIKDMLSDTEIDDIVNSGYGIEDYPIILIAAAKGQVCGISEVLATYSVSPNSVSNCFTIEKKEVFEERVLKVRLDYAKKFGLFDKLHIIIKDSYNLTLAMNGVRYNDKKYCIGHLIAIQEKRLSDYAKLLLCYIPGGFYLLRLVLKDLILK